MRAAGRQAHLTAEHAVDVLALMQQRPQRLGNGADQAERLRRFAVPVSRPGEFHPQAE